MKTKCAVLLVSMFVFYFGSALAWADPPSQFPQNATFTTLITTPRAIEGLTGDNHRNLYTGGSGVPPCPIWQINIHKPKLIEVGFVVPASGNCGFSGIAFDEAENLYVADGAAGIIYFFNPSAKNPPTAAIYAQGVPGTTGWRSIGAAISGRAMEPRAKEESGR